MHVVGAGLVGRALADHGLAANQRRLAVGLVSLGFRGPDGGINGCRVMPIHRSNDMPTVSLKAFGRVVGEPAFHMAVDGNAVVVVQRDQPGQAQRAGQRADFVADAFHQATVAHEGVGEVIDDAVLHAVFLAVELLRQQLFSQCHAHRVGQTLAQRTGGGFHTGRHAHFGVAGSFAVQLAEILELSHRQVIAGQVQQRIEQHGAVAVAQYKAVAVGPVRVGRVVL
jgi:hypothetical protein